MILKYFFTLSGVNGLFNSHSGSMLISSHNLRMSIQLIFIYFSFSFACPLWKLVTFYETISILDVIPDYKFSSYDLIENFKRYQKLLPVLVYKSVWATDQFFQVHAVPVCHHHTTILRIIHCDLRWLQSQSLLRWKQIQQLWRITFRIQYPWKI